MDLLVDFINNTLDQIERECANYQKLHVLVLGYVGLFKKLKNVPDLARLVLRAISSNEMARSWAGRTKVISIRHIRHIFSVSRLA